MILLDFHTHLGKSRDGAFSSSRELLGVLKASDVRHAVVFPIDEAGCGISYHQSNSKIIRLVRSQRHLLGFMRLNPRAGRAALKELHRCVEAGLCGVKLHPRSEDFSPEQSEFLFPEIVRHKLPVILHTSHERNCRPQEWSRLLKRYPGIPVILAHAGKDCYVQAAKMARLYPNLFLETSTLSYFRTRQVIQIAGAGKVLFASDFPYSHPAIESAKLKLAAAPAEQRLILYRNPGRIFKNLT